MPVDQATPVATTDEDPTPVNEIEVEAPPAPVDITALPEAQEVIGKVMQRRPDGGFLSFAPGQDWLSDQQRAVFNAMGVNPDDPHDAPHIMVFVHLCEKRGLDPYIPGEAYLVKRKGKWDPQTRTNGPATYTMQIGIGGYRAMAADTGRQIGGAEILWTGPDDSPDSWREVIDERTGRLRRLRIWQDMWPDSNGFPGAALAIVTHYDDSGNVVTTEHVAHWLMYAPFEDVWEGPSGNRQQKKDPETGEVVQKLNRMWTNGFGHMLGKVAEAGALRKAFPRKLNGFYVTEEMAQADAVEKREREEAMALQRREAYLRSLGDTAPQLPRQTTAPQPTPTPAAGPVEDAVPQDEPEDEETGQQESDGPVPVGDLIADAAPQPSPEQRRAWLIAEVDMIGKIIGQSFRDVLTSRAGATPEELSLEDLTRYIGSFRPRVAPHLRNRGCGHNAAVYEAWPVDYAAPLPLLFGTTEAPVDPGLGWDELNAVEPHPFDGREDDSSRCSECDGYEDDSWHTGTATPPA